MAVTVQFLPRTPRPQTLQSARRLLAGPRSACSQRQGQDVCQTHVTRACNQGKFYDYPHYELPRVPAGQACSGMNRIPLRAQATGSDLPNSLPPPTLRPKSTPTPPSEHRGRHKEGGSSKEPKKPCPEMNPFFISELGKLVHASKGGNPRSP